MFRYLVRSPELRVYCIMIDSLEFILSQDEKGHSTRQLISVTLNDRLYFSKDNSTSQVR